MSDEYLAELKEAGVGVVTVPPDGHEFEHALKILPHDYGDGIWMLEGGGKINAAFLQGASSMKSARSYARPSTPPATIPRFTRLWTRRHARRKT